MKVKVDIPTLPAGAEVSVQGLGVLTNGHSYDFDTEATALYVEFNNLKKAPDALVIGKQPKSANPVAEENKTPADADKKEGA